MHWGGLNSSFIQRLKKTPSRADRLFLQHQLVDLCECAEEAPCRSLAKCRMCSLYPLLENIRDLIPKSACFEILGEGHSASRLCALACSMVPIVRGEQSRPVSTRPRRSCPLLLRFKVQFQSDNGMISSFVQIRARQGDFSPIC